MNAVQLPDVRVPHIVYPCWHCLKYSYGIRRKQPLRKAENFVGSGRNFRSKFYMFAIYTFKPFEYSYIELGITHHWNWILGTGGLQQRTGGSWCWVYNKQQACCYASCPHRAEALSDDPVWRLTSVAYIGPKSRTERPRKTKIGTEVAHDTRDSDTTFKVKRSKVGTCCWCLK